MLLAQFEKTIVSDRIETSRKQHHKGRASEHLHGGGVNKSVLVCLPFVNFMLNGSSTTMTQWVTVRLVINATLWQSSFRLRAKEK